MNAKQYLEQAIVLAENIDAHLLELSCLKEISTASGAINYDNDRVISSVPQTARFEAVVVRLADLENEIREEMKELLQLHSEIRNTIGKVQNPKVQIVLRMRYLARLDVDIVAGRLNVSRKTVVRRLQAGYEEVSRIIGTAPPQRMPARDRHADSRRLLQEVYNER